MYYSEGISTPKRFQYVNIRARYKSVQPVCFITLHSSTEVIFK